MCSFVDPWEVCVYSGNLLEACACTSAAPSLRRMCNVAWALKAQKLVFLYGFQCCIWGYLHPQPQCSWETPSGCFSHLRVHKLRSQRRLGEPAWPTHCKTKGQQRLLIKRRNSAKGRIA